MHDESLAIILAGLGKSELSFKGKFYRFDKVPVTLAPVQRPRPPLWYGLIHPETTVWAAANDANVVTLVLAPEARQIVDRYRAEWAKLGKAAEDLPLIGTSRHLVIAETDAAAMAIARRAYPRWRNSFNYLWRRYAPGAPRSPIAALFPESFDELQEMGNGFAGSPRTVKRLIADQLEASGVNYMAFWLAFGDLTLEESQRSVALFQSEITPSFPDDNRSSARA